jgi:hypothetical protein
VYLTNGIQDANGLAFAGTNWYIYYNSAAITSTPAVSMIAPTNGATAIGSNSTIRITFNNVIDPLSIDTTSLSLTANSAGIPYVASFDSTNTTLTVTPQAPLPVTSQVTLGLTSNVTNPAGFGLTPFSAAFTTGAVPDFNAPVVIASSVTNGQTGVPVTSVFTLTYNKPVDSRTAAINNNVYLYDNTLGYVPLNLSFSADGTQITLAPKAPLAVNRSYYVQACGVQDLNGNSQSQCAQFSFTTALVAPAGGPQVTFALPVNSLQVPTNFSPEIQFDRSIDVTSLAGITLQQAASPVGFAIGTSAGATVATLAPNSLLAPNLSYTLTIAGVKDLAGNVMSGTVTRTFTTGTSIDLVRPTVAAFTPQNGETTGTHPLLRAVFSEPVNPLAYSGWYLQNSATGAYVPGTSLAPSADLMSQSITYPGNLDPNTTYCWYTGTFYDLAGNSRANSASPCFTTSSGPDTAAPAITAVNPPNGQTAVPLNAAIQVRLSKPIDATSISNSSIALSPSAPAGSTVQLSSDGLTLSLSLGAAGTLASNTAYSLTASGFGDLNGNLAAPFTSAFTTSSVTDTARGTITMTSPAANASNAPVNAAITLTLSKPVDPASVAYDTFQVYAPYNTQRIPGTIAVGSGGTTLTFTPTGPLPASTSVTVYAGYFVYLYDLAGNSFNSLQASFTTASTADTTAPTILSVTPTNGTVNVGPNAVVTITFSKAIDYNTINSQNFALYNGITNLNASVNRSSDNRTVTLTATLPYGSTISVSVQNTVRDLAGNTLANSLQSSFNTEAQPLTSSPNVTQMRPANGATGVPLTNTVSLYFSAPMNSATVPGAFYVSQNGALIAGTVTTGPDGRSAVYTPSAPFLNNANLQVFFTGATDTSGNPVNYYSASFSAAQSFTTTPATLVASTPGQYTSTNPLNTVIELQFSKAIQPSTVNASNFYVRLNNSTLVPGSISQFNGNTSLRFAPSSPLTANSLYYVWWTSGLKDADNLALSGGAVYFYTGTGSIGTTPPTVTAFAPFNGATGVGDNATVRFAFGTQMDTLSINTSTVTLTNATTPIPFSMSFSGSSPTIVTLTPQAPLPDSSTVTLSLLAGIADTAGNALAPQTIGFQTAVGADFTAPSVISSSVINGESNVPVNSVFTINWSKPIDVTTAVVNSNVYLYDNSIGNYVPSTLSSPSNGAQITLAPQASLAVNHSYQLYVCGVRDLSGNSQSPCVYYNVTTALVGPAGGPQVTFVLPVNNIQVPTNFQPEIQFDRPIAPSSLSGITLLQGANPIPFTIAAGAGATIVTLTPRNLLPPNLPYTLTIAGAQDAAGNAMTGTVTRSFTTGPNADLVAPQIAQITPQNGEIAGTNPTIRVSFNERINPLAATSWYLRNQNTGVYVVGLAFTASADLYSESITYPGTLAPNTSYCWAPGYFYDLAGNYNSNYYYYYNQPCFTTSSSADNSAPSVTAVNPPNGQAGVPIDAKVQLLLSKPIDATSITATSLTLSPSAPAGASVQLSSNGTTMTLSLGGATLTPNTSYTLSAGGFRDLDGNLVTPFSSAFSTSAIVDTTSGTISMTSPVPNATGVPLNSSITLTLSKAANPASVTYDTFQVYGPYSATRLPGTISIGAGGTTLTFTPAGPMPPSTTVSVFAGYFTSLYDLAGNQFQSLTASFTTASAAQTVAPTVLSVTPANGAQGVGPNAVVTVVFSEAINSSTINSGNFTLFNGYTNLNASVSRSQDNRTVTLSATLPYGASITLAVSTGVMDLSGNALASPFEATFTTVPQPLTSAPNVTQMRPANGATGVPLNSPVSLYFSAPLNSATVQGAFNVSQNGALIAGAVTDGADGRSAVFTPTAPLQNNANIQVYFSGASDTSGNLITSYTASFRTAPSTIATAATLVATTPGQYTSGNSLDTLVEVQFSKAIKPATVTASNIYLTQSGGGTVFGSLAQFNGADSIRFIPIAFLPPSTSGPTHTVALMPNSTYTVNWTNGLIDSDNLPLAGGNFYFTTGTISVGNAPPTVTSFTPFNGATGVGDNATIRFTFSKPMDTLSINPSTVTLMNGAAPIPYSMSFSGSTPTAVTLTPQAPLPDSSTLTLSLSAGITDTAGNAISAQSVSFQTAAGADFGAPGVIYSSVDSNTPSVPVNSAFTLIFDKSLDPTTVSTNPYYYYGLYDGSTGAAIPVTVTVSPDGRTVTFVPSANLAPSHSLTLYARYAADLTGNAQTNFTVSFTTGASTDTAPLQVLDTNPAGGGTGAPLNSLIEIQFNKAVRATSLSQISLMSAGNAVSSTASLIYADSTVLLTPASLLQPDTTYTVVVQAVQDVAGNTQTGSRTFTFTTGPNVLSGPGPHVLSIVASGLPLSASQTLNVPDGPAIVVAFDASVEAASLYLGGATLVTNANTNTKFALSVALSPDQKTATFTLASGTLAAGTQYRFRIGYYSPVRDSAGDSIYQSIDDPFTTQ